LGILHVQDAAVEHGTVLESIRSALGVPAATLRMAGTGRRVTEISERIRTLTPSPAELRELETNALMTLIDSMRELTLDAWAYSTTTNLVASAAQALVRKVAADLDLSAMRGGTAGLASACLLGGVHRLADLARTQPQVGRALRSEAAEDLVKRLDDVDPMFAAAFWTLIAEAGHRGPGETELANPMYSDNPAQLIDVVRMALDVQDRTVPNLAQLSGVPRRAVAALNAALRRRERSKDVAMRATHALRLALREVGRRQVDAGVLDEVGDIFYLVPDEVFAPALYAERIPARRAERARLSALNLPTTFTLRWEPLGSDDADSSSVALRGIGASPGIVRGPVRVVHAPDDIDDIEPDTVLAVHVTDVGWTPLFGCVAAVVTDVGGLHSHAAIVAREFGIPCVVGTDRATLDLENGRIVEVDGTCGTVTSVQAV
jgi:phosphohistidine swiveling domain-containing protein